MCPIVPSGGWVDGPIIFETESVWARKARKRWHRRLLPEPDLVAGLQVLGSEPRRRAPLHTLKCVPQTRV